MHLTILNPARSRLKQAWLRRWHLGLTQELRRRRRYKQLVVGKALTVVFVSRAEMRRLNRTYRGKDYVTDVLSFAPSEKDLLGELVLCLSHLRKQAKSTGLGELGELGYMLIHGVLHLLGHDHERPNEAKHMFKLQDEIYHKLRLQVGLR